MPCLVLIYRDTSFITKSEWHCCSAHGNCDCLDGSILPCSICLSPKTGPKNRKWQIEHGRIKREVSTSNFHSVIWGVLLLSIFFLRRSGIFFLAMGYLMLGHLGKGWVVVQQGPKYLKSISHWTSWYSLYWYKQLIKQSTPEETASTILALA